MRYQKKKGRFDAIQQGEETIFKLFLKTHLGMEPDTTRVFLVMPPGENYNLGIFSNDKDEIKRVDSYLQKLAIVKVDRTS